MRTRMTVVYLTTLWILAAGAVRGQESDMTARVRLELVLAVKNGGYGLEGELRSEDSRTFVLRKVDLPWGEGRTLHLDTFIPDSRGAKLGRRPFSPPTRDAIRLEAERSLSGELNLGSVLVGLEETLRLHPVIIFWAYEFSTGDPRVAGEWQAGSFVIPKGGLPEGTTLR